MVVHAFRRLGVARHLVVAIRVCKRLLASGEHLVSVALMRHVEHEFVHRRVHHIMHSHCGLHHAEVRAHVSAMHAEFLNQRLAHLST